ncbi:hypothetical protein D3C76_1178980 [compost metagenome]
MVGRHLAVDKHEAGVSQVVDQGHEADLGGVVGVAEHRFAKEQLAHGEAVQAPDQFAVLANFDRMSDAAAVQLAVGVAHGVGDPGAVSVVARRGAGGDHGREVGVEADLVAALAHQLGQRA